MGCKHCYGAVVTNLFNELLQAVDAELVQHASERRPGWPPLPGDYSVLCDGKSCSVAVSTLASEELAEALARAKPERLSIVGKTETENIGIDKLVTNIISNPNIRFLIVAGRDPEGHRSGATLKALFDNGVDPNMRVIGSPGKRPVLRNLFVDDVAALRNQVALVDMIGTEDTDAIIAKIAEVVAEKQAELKWRPAHTALQDAPTIEARSPNASEVQLDKAGYFVVIPNAATGRIAVEHYDYDNKLLRTIEGADARSLYSTIIEHGWLSSLGHAAYLGKELEKAELSIRFGFKYVQDGA